MVRWALELQAPHNTYKTTHQRWEQFLGGVLSVNGKIAQRATRAQPRTPRQTGDKSRNLVLEVRPEHMAQAPSGKSEQALLWSSKGSPFKRSEQCAENWRFRFFEDEIEYDQSAFGLLDLEGRKGYFKNREDHDNTGAPRQKQTWMEELLVSCSTPDAESTETKRCCE